jgi:hypothetical protein
MPIRVEIDHAGRRILATAYDRISLPDVLEFMRTVRVGDLAPYSLLFDVRDVRTDVIGPDIGRMVEEVKEIASRQKRGPAAIVAAGSNLGLAKMYETLLARTGLAVRAFSDVALAEQWLADVQLRQMQE